MKRFLIFSAVTAALLGLVIVTIVPFEHSKPAAPYTAPRDATVTRLDASTGSQRTLVIEAATDISFMRPFLVDFQRTHPDIAVIYSDMLSTRVLDRALVACRTGIGAPDIYLTVATDHLVRLANDGCGLAIDSSLTRGTPGWKKWRNEVFAFALEPAVFVYDRQAFQPQQIPQSHLALLQMLRSEPLRWDRQMGTYDIRQSGIGYNFAEFDSRQSSIFGRLIESLGRSRVRLYCCSDEMVLAVGKGEIKLAYNVQLSYAYFAQAKNRRVGIVIPSDYQAVQTRSLLIARDAEHLKEAQEFLEYLLSPRAQAIDLQLLTPPGMRQDAPRLVASDRLLSQIDVSAELLRLQDAARRRRLTREWVQAVGAGEHPQPGLVK